MTIVTERPSASRPRPSVRESTSRVLEVPEPPRPRWRMGTRLFVGNALFLLSTLLLVVAFASWDANRRAERRVREAMQPVPKILHGWVEAQERTALDQVAAFADSVSTKALLSLAGTEAATATFHDSALEQSRRLGGAAVFLFDPNGSLLARSDRESGEEAGRDFSTVSWVGGPLANGTPTAAFILELKRQRSLSLVAAAPVSQGESTEARTLGVAALATPLGQAQAREIGGLISGEAMLVIDVARRGRPTELALLAASGELGSVAPNEVLDPNARAALFSRGDDAAGIDFTVGQERYSGAAIPLSTGAGEPIAALVAARPKSAEMAAFRALRGSVLAVGLLALAVSLPLSLGFARRTSRPIEQLAAGAEALRTGNLEVPLPKEARDAEVNTLTRAFGALVLELEEKRALEKLLAQSRRSDSTEIVVPASGDATAESIKVGQLLAHRYHVKAILGGGGMGRVFRAHDLELDEEVAIKVLSPQVFEKHESSLLLLRQEIRVARAITHPNVVRVHDLGESDGLRFLTMEFVSGTTLRRLMARGYLGLVPSLQVAKQLCRGLGAVHAAGIVHGDVKPENLMVLPNGVVKLMDFGLARRAGLIPDRNGSVVGTPVYMSPEHARGAELDERSDLYAVGVLMYELFTGHAPFEAEEFGDLLRQHLYAPALDPREMRPELPATLAEVILVCLAKNRLERPGSAAELEQALMRVRM